MSIQATPRKARLYITRVDPWSVAKAAFMLSLAMAIVIVVAVAVLWYALDALGVFQTLARNVNEVIGNAQNAFDLMSLLDFGRVMGVAVVIASVEIVLVSIMATLFAFMYNLSVALTGGIEIVVSDE